jgi:hypothetical protein
MEKTHSKDPLCHVPERKRTAKIFAHGKGDLSRSGGGHGPPWPTLGGAHLGQHLAPPVAEQIFIRTKHIDIEAKQTYLF